jgi:hypothetical protein
MTIPREQHNHDVFSSASSQIAVMGAALVAMLIIVWYFV